MYTDRALALTLFYATLGLHTTEKLEAGNKGSVALVFAEKDQL